MRRVKMSKLNMLFTASITLLFAFFCFLGFNFLSGEIGDSIKQSMIIFCFLFIPVSVAKWLKVTNKPSKFKVIIEGVLLLLFAIFAWKAITPFSHIFKVLVYERADIQKTLNDKIKQTNDMFKQYEIYAENRLNGYKDHLNSTTKPNNKKINPKDYKNCGFVKGTDDSTQIEQKLNTLKTQLLYEYDKEIKEDGFKWLSKAKDMVNRRIFLLSPGDVAIINTIDTTVIPWKENIKGFSEWKAPCEKTKDFDYNLSFDEVTNKIKEHDDTPLISIILAIILYALILLSYYVSDRCYDLKIIFENKSIEDL